MSRIHEALKKAELESAAGFATATAPEKARLEDVTLAPDKPLRRKEEFSPELVHFENLIARCSKADWKLNLHANLDPQEELRRSERFRMLRSRLYQLRTTRKLGSLLVTSALPAEGKTFVASNLALIIARQPGSKVLLLDADMRFPQLHVALGTPGRPGLTEYLGEEACLEEVLQHGNQGNLCFIPAGKAVANPAELIAGPRMKSLLELLYKAFDWIIVDGPPVLLVSDPLVLADLVDGVLQVVAAGFTDREDAQKACREFQDKSLLGVVLNRGVPDPRNKAGAEQPR
jgi:protein-tyrosine kinase